MKKISFNCTQCGKCCHALNLPLTAQEAIDWSKRGGNIKILTEGIPWTDDTLLSDSLFTRKKAITFEAMSGSLAIRVAVTLVGYYSDACPNLDDNQNCSIYEQRPLTCRIYPFEMNPQIQLNPIHKLCPQDAWQTVTFPDRTIPEISPAVYLIDELTRDLITKLYETNSNDVLFKKALCAKLGIKSCSLSNNGYLFHLVEREQLNLALKATGSGSNQHLIEREPTNDSWLIYSNNQQTLEDLKGIGANSSLSYNLDTTSQEFISLV